MKPSQFHVVPGAMITERYRIERVLGRGGMGVVVAARHVDLDERVAIKLLLGRDRTEADARRFLREARAAAKVKSEHVCRVFDFGRLGSGEPYLVMEYLEGVDLATKLGKEGPLRVNHAAGWIIEVCEALTEAHDAGVVHRDLKPANVFLAKRKDGSFTAKVLDFGVSTMPSDAGWTTQSLVVAGTPLYMAPEQIETKRPVDARTDLWGLGVTLYEILSGRAPFEGGSLVELAHRILTDEPVDLQRVNPEVPRALSTIVMRCLAKDPDERYPSAAALASALAPFANSQARALAARMSRLVVRASDPFLEIDSSDGSEPTFPNSVQKRFLPLPAKAVDRASEPATRKPVDAPPPKTRTLRSRPVLVLAAVLMAAGLVVGAPSSTGPSRPEGPVELAASPLTPEELEDDALTADFPPLAARRARR